MNSKQIQNIIYTAAKNNLVTPASTVFATQFDNVVNKVLSIQDDDDAVTNVLCNYFLSLGLKEIVDNDLVDLKYDKELEKRINEAISSLQKIESLSSSQSYLIDYIKNQTIKIASSKQQNIDFIDDTDISQDININTFVQSFNSIFDKQDISSILNFIQINGFQQLYINQINDGQEPILLFKLIYDEINSKENQKLVSQQAEAKSFYKLASSKDDEQFKQNCQFLSEDKIEFPVKEDSSKLWKNFTAYSFDIQLNNKKYANVQQLFNAIIADPDNFIINLKEEEIKEIKEKLLAALKEATKGLNAELGFPEAIKGDEYSAEQLLNWVLNKTVDKRYIDLIEILFTEDDMDLYKNTAIYDDETLYEGIYYDFKSVFDEDIKPPFDTGYKMTDDPDVFWKAAVKLERDLIENEEDIKKCFKEFGQIAFNCNDYMTSIKILFTILNNVTEDRIYMCLLYVCIVTTDNIFGKVWNAVKNTTKKAVNTVSSLFGSQIYFRDREYVYPINMLNEKGAYKGYSLKQALEKIQTDFKSYKIEHKDETMKDYVISIYKNLDQYIQTSTDSSVNAEYVQTSDNEYNVQLSQEMDQYVTTITTNTEAVAKQLKNEDVMVNNGQMTLEQYNFLNN